MTDFTAPVNWDLSGPYLAALIQFPNAVGALLSIFTLRSGKAMIVSPTINGLYPVIKIVLSLAIYNRLPERWNAIGMVLAVTAIVMMSYGEALQPERSAGHEVEPSPAVKDCRDKRIGCNGEASGFS